MTYRRDQDLSVHDIAHSKSVAWLFTPLVRATPPHGSELGEVLKAYRIAHDLSPQAELAELLHLDQSYVSLVQNKKRLVRDERELRRMAVPVIDTGNLETSDNDDEWPEVTSPALGAVCTQAAADADRL